MRIFITGAGGFVGGALARVLKSDHEVWGLVRRPEQAHTLEKEGIKPIIADILDLKPDQFPQVDWVIHAAAKVESWGTREDFLKVNVEGTKRMLDLAKRAGAKKFLLISTEAVLFNGYALNEVDEKTPYPENYRFLYPETKKLAEEAVLKANEPGVFETMAIRPRLVWGLGDTIVLPALIAAVKSGKFRFPGGSKVLTETTHIKNLIHGAKLIFEKGKGGEAYFITDDQRISYRELFTKLLKTQNIDPGEKNIPMWLAKFSARFIEFLWKAIGKKSRPPLNTFSLSILSCECKINISKAKKELGYEPVIGLEEGLEELTPL